VFDGEFTDGGLIGKYKRGEVNSTFTLVKKVPVSLQEFDSYTGNYEISPGRILSVGVHGNTAFEAVFSDSKTRKMGLLYPMSATEFFTDPTYSIPLPVVFKIKFITENGQVTGLDYTEKNGSTVRAKKIAQHRQEEIRFKNGDADFLAMLYTPATKRPHPTIIMIRPGYDLRLRYGGDLIPFFVRQGFAVFTLAKRTVKGTVTNYNNSSFEDRSKDIIAGLNTIKQRKDIDANKIGLFGSSLSGWLAPITATLSSDVSFMVLQVPSALPVAENILFEIENNLRDQNILSPGSFTEEDIKKTVGLRRLLNKTILSNEGWDALKNEIEISKKERWFGYARVGWFPGTQTPPDAATLKRLQDPISYDPVPVLEKITIPLIALNAGYDANVETNRSVPLLVNALKKAGNKSATVVILPFASHGLLEVDRGIDSEYFKIEKSTSGYHHLIADWLKHNVIEK
jgi:dienelactone hydrolase